MENEAMEREALDTFGRFLMEQVRDRAIILSDKTMTGEMKGDYTKSLHEMFATFNPKQWDAAQKLIPIAVDWTIYSLLCMFDQQQEFAIVAYTRDGIVPSLSEASDALPSELYLEDGWIARFSKQRHEPIEE